LKDDRKERRHISGYSAPLSNVMVIAAMYICLGAVCAQCCTLQIRAFDPIGNTVKVEIQSIELWDPPRVDLLKSPLSKGKIQLDGARVLFRTPIEGIHLLIGFAQENDSRVELAHIPMLRCGQISTVVIGQRETGADVAASELDGRLVGCACSGSDLWVRLVPMFGATAVPRWFEASVDPSRCSFTLVATMLGVRHILIVGRGNQSIKTVDVNILAGGRNDIGKVDIGSSCGDAPKK
jgi:hypothetical protein